MTSQETVQNIVRPDYNQNNENSNVKVITSVPLTLVTEIKTSNSSPIVTECSLKKQFYSYYSYHS